MLLHPEFGGGWTEQKLEILSRYLKEYTKVFRNRPGFSLTYVDAFAGSGSYRTRDASLADSYGDFDEFRRGSASIALEIDNRPFDRLLYIERNAEFARSLQAIKADNPEPRIDVVNGDANKVLPQFCAEMSEYDRAVVFLDPFKTSVDWSTVEAIARSEKIDCWILFPLMALTRMMNKNKRPKASLVRQLDRVFGGRSYWEDQLYRPALQQLLFSDGELVSREPQDRIAEVYRDRLDGVFEAVAPTRRQLTNSHNSKLFEFIFAASNRVGAGPAIRIADHILSHW